MYFTIPASGGEPEADHALLEVNHCHGKSSGHPCGGGGTEHRDFGVETHKVINGQRVGATIAVRAQSRDEAVNKVASAGHTISGGVWEAPGGKFEKGKGPFTRVHDDGVSRPRSHANEPMKKPEGSTFTPSGPNHITSHRGVEIHALPGYTTPYYYGKHPKLGSMQHSPSLRRVKNMINRVLDPTMSPKKAQFLNRSRSGR